MYRSDRIKILGPLVIEYFEIPAPGNPQKSPFLDPTKNLNEQTWNSVNSSRVIYDESSGILWYGDSVRSAIRTLSDVPRNLTVLFETDTQQLGYTLLSDRTDGVIYYTRGSVAGGEAGGSMKSGGTWTAPTHSHTLNAHNHTIGEHTHTLSNHTHSAQDHTHVMPSFTLTVATMPGHAHTGENNRYFVTCGGGTGRGGNSYSCAPLVDVQEGGGSISHSHNITATAVGTETGYPTPNVTGSTGGVATESSGAVNSSSNNIFTNWRPQGRNMTRQRRN